MKTRLIIAILLMTCTAAWAQKDVAAIKKAEGKGHVSGSRYAVVVGVSDYKADKIRDLAYAANDARLMAKSLTNTGLFDRVYLFADGEPDAEPTFINVLKKVKVIAENAGPNDMILFYFSGHGFPDINEGHNYLAAMDTDPDLLNKTGIGLQEVYGFFNDSDARAKVILLDACHSGARKDKAGDVLLQGNYMYNGEGSITLASSKFEQSSYEWPEKQSGVFTWFLSQGISGDADNAPFGNGDGLVTSHELNQYTTQKVAAWAADNNVFQTPRKKDNMTGDVVLGVTGHGQPAVIKPQVSTGRSCPPGMVYIQPGSFTMGCSSGDESCADNEKPAKKVTISRGYCMDIYEATNSDYAAFLNANGNVCLGNECVDSDSDWLRLEGSGRSWKVKSGWDSHPMTEVSWYGAKAYCESLGKRLPTEAQWEFAARAATTTPYYWGSEMRAGQANFCDAMCSQKFKDATINDGYETTAPVGSYAANNYGLYDMAGNVWEWVEDCYDAEWYSTMPSRDPMNICKDSVLPVVRGGTWIESAWNTRVSTRAADLPFGGRLSDGFRCAKDIE